MGQKPITSIQAEVKKSMENLYDSCRRGKINEIPKLHKKFSKAKEALEDRLTERSEKHGQDKQ